MTLADRFSYSENYHNKCTALLDTAFNHVPVYKAWKGFDPGANAPLDERFAALPALTKEDIRNNFPLGLMPEGQDLQAGLASEEIEYTFTSGTTSERVVNIWDQDWWNRSEAAAWKLHSTLAALPYPQKQAKLASSLNVGICCEEDLPMAQRILGDTLYLNEKISLLQWQPRHYRRMVEELNAYQPVILEANPSLLARLAYWIIDNGLSVFSPQAIVFTFEFPSAIHLAALRRVFSSAFVSSYGSTETGFVLQQCADGLLHQNTDFCRIDFEPLKPVFGGPELGRIFVSTFDNPWNCIIRFDVGDLVRLHPDGQCACPNAGGMIADAIEGRIANVTFGVEGNLVSTKMLDDALATVPALRDYHMEQTDRTQYILRVMLEPDANTAAAQKNATDALHAALQTVYGRDGSYDIQILDTILPGPAGKFRRTQANFSFDEGGLFQ